MVVSSIRDGWEDGQMSRRSNQMSRRRERSVKKDEKRELDGGERTSKEDSERVLKPGEVEGGRSEEIEDVHDCFD